MLQCTVKFLNKSKEIFAWQHQFLRFTTHPVLEKSQASPNVALRWPFLSGMFMDFHLDLGSKSKSTFPNDWNPKKTHPQGLTVDYNEVLVDKYMEVVSMAHENSRCIQTSRSAVLAPSSSVVWRDPKNIQNSTHWKLIMFLTSSHMSLRTPHPFQTELAFWFCTYKE